MDGRRSESGRVGRLSACHLEPSWREAPRRGLIRVGGLVSGVDGPRGGAARKTWERASEPPRWGIEWGLHRERERGPFRSSLLFFTI